MAQNYTEFQLTSEWQDVYSQPGYSALRGTRVTAQAVSGQAETWFTSVGAPTANNLGNRVGEGAAVTGTAQALYARGSGFLALLQED
jgi:hypothetical protein